jgi:hypothetical protein
MHAPWQVVRFRRFVGTITDDQRCPKELSICFATLYFFIAGGVAHRTFVVAASSQAPSRRRRRT